jgi:hypothetical protein
VIKGAAIWIFLAVAVLCIALAATGCFVAAFYLWIAPHLGAAAAAAITGAALLGVAAFLALAGGVLLRQLKRRRVSLMAEFGSILGLASRLTAMLVRKDPKKALLVSLVVGALAEYISVPRRKS